MGEYSFTNGSGQTFKLTITAGRATTDPHQLAIAIDPDKSDSAEFCKIVVSQMGPEPDTAGLQSVRQALTEAILAEQDKPDVPADIVTMSDTGAASAANNLISGDFLRACTVTSDLIQPGINVGILADGINSEGATQAQFNFVNANGLLLAKTTASRDGTSVTNQNDPDNVHPYDRLEIDEDATGKPTAVQMEFDGQNGATADFSSVGQVLGSALGRALAPNNQFLAIGASTVIGAAGQKLAEAFSKSLLTDGATINLDSAFNNFHISIAGAGAGAVASFLTAEVGHARASPASTSNCST